MELEREDVCLLRNLENIIGEKEPSEGGDDEFAGGIGERKRKY